MKPSIQQLLRSIVSVLMLVAGVQSSRATTAYLLDTAGLGNIDELYLVGTLQGVVNRDAPRLFLTNVAASNCNGAGNTYVNYLQSQKGFTFVQLRSLNDAVATFAALKRADGITPLIKGMIKYQTTYWDNALGGYVYKYYNNSIAANFAAQEDLIAVTDSVLNNQSQMLSATEFWYKDTAMTSGWGDNFATVTTSTNGRSVTPRSGRSAKVIAENFNCYSARVVYVDLAVTPKIEVVVIEVSAGGIWSLGIAMGSTVDTYAARQFTQVPALTNVTTSGTFTVDLAASGLFNPTSGRAQLAICPMTDASTVTVKSIRFLATNGQDPATPLYVPPKSEFSTLTINRDLTVSRPYADDEASACTWSLANQRANCDPGSFGSFSNGSWILQGLDYAIARKSFLFYQNLEPFSGPYPNLDIILSGLQQPSMVFGWLGGESSSCMKMAQYGSRYAGGPSENWSFWQWVPLDNPNAPVLSEPARQVTTLENKNYVAFCWASSDASELSLSLMQGYWGDSNRGNVPVTWGFNPTLPEMVPAMVEYFGKTATPNDSFWNGVSGAGYTQPSSMPDSSLALYADATRRGIAKLGTTPALDYSADATVSCPAYFDALTTSTSAYPAVKLISALPDSSGISKNYWLDNGTPVLQLDQTGLSGNSAETDAASIQAAIAKHPESGPKFIIYNTRCSPTYLLAVKNLLPSNFTVVGIQDFVGLAQDAGALAAVPYSDSVGAGDSVQISIELHNASGNTGGAGTVSWNLPTGWTASQDNWAHGTVATGSNLKQVVTFTPPAGMTSGTAGITFSDSRFTWTKQVLLTTYADGRTVTDCQSASGWSTTGGAGVSMDGGMVKVVPMTPVMRYEYWSGTSVANNGRAAYWMGWVDLSRNPVLKLNIPEEVSVHTTIGISDETGAYKSAASTINAPANYSIDIKAVTGWSGERYLALNLDPVKLYGKYLKVRSSKLCYPLGQPAPLVVNSGTAILSSNPYVTLNGGAILADPAQGATRLSILNMAAGGTLVTGTNFTLATSQLSGTGTLTVQGQGNWACGVSLQPGDNSAFTGKIVLNNTWLWATDSVLGAVPSSYTADALTLNNSTLVNSGTMPTNRGITLGTGLPQIYGSVATLNNKITGIGSVRVRYSTLLLNTPNDFAGNYYPYSSTTIIGVDNALPHGAGKGDVSYADWDGAGSTIDLNGHTLTINGLTYAKVTGSSNLDNNAATPATLVVGDNNATGSFDGIIKNTGAELAFTKIGTGKQTLTNVNTYSGNTVITAGVLALSGSGNLSNSPVIDVRSGAAFDVSGLISPFSLGAGTTLMGSGTVNGPIVSAGTIVPGNGIGMLTTGPATLSGSLCVEVNGAAADKLVTNGNLTLNGAALSLTLSGSFTGPYVIAQANGGTIIGTFASVPAGYSVTYSSTQATLDNYSSWATTNGILGADSNADSDGDGMTNLQEFLAGTTPLDRASTLRINSVAKSGNDVVINFPSVIGKSYVAEKSTTLAPGSWSVVQDNIPGTGGVVTVTDSGGASLPRAFYHIKLK